MKVISVILSLSAIFLTCLSFTTQKSDPPKKKYKDTIYEFKLKTSTRTGTKPVASSKPSAVAEEDRNITINSMITRYVVKKSSQKMYVYFGDTFKVFRISLGTSPFGHKTRKGDNKTPEGTYKITFKNPNSRGYKSLKISYPNQHDRLNAQKMGVNPGGDICIHGLWWKTQDPQTHWKDNWTQGCIAVNNQQIDEIYKYAAVDTEITILP